MNLDENKQVVIFLGGTPAAGKTTTCRWIQKLSDYGFVMLQSDLFAPQWPQTFAHYVPGEEFKHYPQYDKYFKLELEGEQVSVKLGPDFDKFFNIRFVMFEYLMNTGHNVIVEDTFEDDTDLDNYLKHIDPQKQSRYIFRLVATEEEIEERRQYRDGIKGEDRKTFMSQEDLVINTTNIDPQDVAQTIIKYIADNPR